jgi:transcriptional regulator with XRE-family HTH domain
MDRKTLLRNIGEKLRNIRDSLKLERFQMADRIDAYRTSYYRYEIGETSPQLTSLYRLGHTDNISMDWLILNRGPMHYKDKEISLQATPEPPKETVPPIALERDVKELLVHMEKSPLLRHEILLMFYKFKEEHKELF